jgi:UPF0755 protein
MIYKKIKILVFIFLIVIIAVSFFYNRAINKSADKNGNDVVFVIESGQGVNQISENLYDQGLIGSKFYFEIYLWRQSFESKIQAGEYILNPILSIKEISKIFVEGRTMENEKIITTIEGWNAREIGQYLEREGMFQSEELLELVGYPMIDYRYNNEMAKSKDYSGQFSFLADKPDYLSLEGYLFPDTYRIFNNASLDSIVIKMLDNFDKKLTSEMREDIKAQGKTIYEIVTMASLIEKEVRGYGDMRIVSGIFWDRIKNRQALESCATLAYVLGENKKQYTLEDTKIDSPYNSYKNLGLMPGPISNPGINAIKAAIYPEYTDYNFFLTASETGETIFSKTFDEHIRNKSIYIK